MTHDNGDSASAFSDASDFYGYIHRAAPDFVEISTLPKIGVPYMDANNRMRWALSEWEKMIRYQAEEYHSLVMSGQTNADELTKRLQSMGWKILCNLEKIEIMHTDDHQIAVDSYAIFSCYIRDPFGNEAKEWGMVTLKQWPAFLEKAATKARARALQDFGFGTAFAIDMDDNELMSIEYDPSNMADGVAPTRAQRPVAAPKPVPAPTTAPKPAAAPAATTAPKTAAPTNPRNTPGIKGKNRERITELAVHYPGFIVWAKKNKFGYGDGDFRDIGYESDAVRLRENEEGWLLEYRQYLKETNTSLEQLLTQLKTTLASKGKTYESWAAEQGITIETPTAASEVDEPDPDYQAFLALGGEKLLPLDPESPTIEQWKAMMNELTRLGGSRNPTVVNTLKGIKTWYRKDIRPLEYFPADHEVHDENAKTQIKWAYTVTDTYKAYMALKAIETPEPQAFAA